MNQILTSGMQTSQSSQRHIKVGPGNKMALPVCLAREWHKLRTVQLKGALEPRRLDAVRARTRRKPKQGTGFRLPAIVPLTSRHRRVSKSETQHRRPSLQRNWSPTVHERLKFEDDPQGPSVYLFLVDESREGFSGVRLLVLAVTETNNTESRRVQTKIEDRHILIYSLG